MNFEFKQISSTLVRDQIFTEMRRYLLQQKPYREYNISDLKVSFQRTQQANRESVEVHIVTYADVCSCLIIAGKPETGKIEILMTFFTKVNIFYFYVGQLLFSSDNMIQTGLAYILPHLTNSNHKQFLTYASYFSVLKSHWIAMPEVLRDFDQNLPNQIYWGTKFTGESRGRVDSPLAMEKRNEK